MNRTTTQDNDRVDLVVERPVLTVLNRFSGLRVWLRRQPRSAPTPRALGVGLGRWIAAGELSVPVVAAVCGLPDVIVNTSVTRRPGGSGSAPGRCALGSFTPASWRSAVRCLPAKRARLSARSWIISLCTIAVGSSAYVGDSRVDGSRGRSWPGAHRRGHRDFVQVTTGPPVGCLFGWRLRRELDRRRDGSLRLGRNGRWPSPRCTPLHRNWGGRIRFGGRGRGGWRCCGAGAQQDTAARRRAGRRRRDRRWGLEVPSPSPRRREVSNGFPHSRSCRSLFRTRYWASPCGWPALLVSRSAYRACTTWRR